MYDKGIRVSGSRKGLIEEQELLSHLPMEEDFRKEWETDLVSR